MSAPLVRRMKDGGVGGGGKVSAIKPSKSLTPLSVSHKKPFESLKRSSSGKENLRSGARVPLLMSQKPAVRQMPRIDKVVAATRNDGGETRLRFSTSSVPRGRSSSPSEFFRVFSDMSRERGSRVSVCRSESNNQAALSGGKGTRGLESSKQKKGFRDSNGEVNEGTLSGLSVMKDSKEYLEKKNGFCKRPNMNVKENEKILSAEVNLNMNLIKSTGVGEICNDRGSLDVDMKVQCGVRVDSKGKEESCFVSKSKDAVVKVRNDVDLIMKESVEKSLSNSKISGILKEKGKSEEVTSSHGINKYPSRLHEKLAFLEGKVKRIASDIKKTKEMLDKNNPDASKVILSDIHDKILGIEKAMNHVGSDSDSKMGISKSNRNCDQEMQIPEKSQSKQVDKIKSLVKGLNREELEARFFPHHKLLKNRTSLKESDESSHSLDEPHVIELGHNSKAEDKSLSPIDDNPIALEFLAFLNKEQNEGTARDEHGDLEFCEAEEVDGAGTSAAHGSSCTFNGKHDAELILTTDEKLDEFDDQENKPGMMNSEEMEDICSFQLKEIGCKNATGGWFVSEGESVLLAHDDGSCSLYDIANCEEKAEYKPPAGVSPNIWRDCWIIRAPGADGCSGRYVVAASAGNTMDSGFCSWDFYTKDVRAFHIEGGNRTTSSRTVLGQLPNNTAHRRNSLSNILLPEDRQWWYKPCGPLIVSTASCQSTVRAYDIRDSELIMKWEVLKPVATMDYSSPLQWRNRGKVVVAEAETISLWDVNSLNPQALLSVSLSGRKISALHVNNTDAEVGGGVRQRVSSSDAEGNDGVFCTSDSLNVLDFRTPTGVGLKIPKLGANVQSVFARGDSVFLGCSSARSAGKEQSCLQVQQFSLRNQKLFSSYAFPESNAHFHHTAITQVWGNSNLVMGVSGQGLSVFDAMKDDIIQKIGSYSGSSREVREVIGPDDLYSPSFDYSSSYALLISRDRPAMWSHLS